MKESFQLKTDRLILVPLTAIQLRHWIQDVSLVETELNCRYAAEPLEGTFAEIVREQSRITDADSANFPFHSFWWLIRNEDRVVVGSADFKDLPDTQGAVEIGYGLGKDFERQGYMTEAVQTMCAWALQQPSILSVTAETEKEGGASQRLLKRCGFVCVQSAQTLWWKKEKNQAQK